MATITSPNNSSSLTTALSGTPVATDNVVLDQGDQDIVSNLNGISGVALTSLRSMPARTGSIGGDGTSLEVDAATIELLDSGRFHKVAGVATKTIASFDYIPAAAGTLTLSAAAVTDLALLAGNAEIESSADVTNAYVAGAENTTFKQGAAAMTLLSVAGKASALAGGGIGYTKASCTLERDAATVTAGPGALVAFTHDDVSPATVNVNGGRVNVERCTSIGTANASSGIVDASKLTTSIATITWSVTGPLTIIKPASSSVAFDLPTSAESKAGTVRVLEAAEAVGMGL